MTEQAATCIHKRLYGTGCLCLMALAALLIGMGCASSNGSSQRFQQAVQLWEAGEFEQAVPILKAHLVEHPFDSAAHFYLGDCYLYAEDSWFNLARGEYEVALNIYERQGRKSPIPRFPDDYFAVRCYLQISKVFQMQILYLLDFGAPRDVVLPLLEGWKRANDAARAIDPDSPDVEHYDGLIEEFESMLNPDDQPAPSPEAPAPPRPSRPVV